MFSGRSHPPIITGRGRAGDRRAAPSFSPRQAFYDVRSRSTHRRLLVCAALSLLAAWAPVASAQRVLGIGEDATVVPRGAVRISALGAWSAYNELYGPGGRLEALGAPLSTDSLGAAQLELLRPIQTSIRALAQLPGANISLGPARTDISARIARSAVTVDLGLTSRLMLTATLPYEHTITEAVLDVNPRDVSTNPANVGINPARTAAGLAAAQNRRVVDSVLRAAGQLATRLAACTTTPGDPVCANRPQVEALVLASRAFATGVATTYGTGADTAPGSPLVPLTGSTLQSAIAARVASLNASFKTYIPTLAAWETPAPAQAPLSAGVASALLSETLGVPPIGLVERSHIGDIEVGAKLLLLDTFGGAAAARSGARQRGFRFAVGGLARLGTGQIDRPNELVDVGTGDGQTDIEANGAIDFVFGRRLWGSVVGRYGVQMKDEQLLRIPNVARNPFAAEYREQTVSRDLGDYMELQATPRYVYNDYVSLSAQWTYRRKAEDTYTGTFTVTDPLDDPVSLDASILGIGTKQSEQRVGGGIAFSTLRAYDRGRANVPVEIQLLHWQAVSGSGYVPKRFNTQVQLRYYMRLFGAPLRPARPAAGSAPRPAR